MNKGERWVEGGIHDPERVIWTNSYVLWTNQFSSNISNNDGQDLIRLDQH